MTIPVDKEMKEVWAECYNDSKFMAGLVFPDAFYSPMTMLHDQIFDLLDKSESNKKVIAATRGIGKTTIAELICKKAILFEDYNFIGYVSNSSGSAELITENIKQELTSNEIVLNVFGDVSASKVKGVSDKWTQKAWIANGKTFVLPRGAKQQVRGLKWGNKRPDLWIIDDLEDDEEIMNPEQRKKLKEWFEGSLLYTEAQYEDAERAKFIYIDTVKHEDALITHLLEDPEWDSITLSVCDDNYKTLVPTFISQERLDKEVERHRRNHTLDVFARERMSVPTAKETRAFKGEYFKYYEETDNDFVTDIKPRLINILIWDPAKRKNPKNAQTGLVVWGLDLERNAFYLRHSSGEFLSVGEQHDRVFALVDQYDVQVVGMEVTGLEEHLTYPFLNECMRRGRASVGTNMIELKARTGKGEMVGEEGGKDGRISGLLPFYERGLIFHNKANSGPLELQLLSFPRSKLKDIMDAAAYLLQMLEKGAKYMSPVQLESQMIIDDESQYRRLAQQDEQALKLKLF